MAQQLILQITTKSDLILRDLDLLRQISRREKLSVNITITTLNRDLARALEPRAPSPARRLQTLVALREAGIPAGVFLMPLIPAVNDSQEELDALAEKARAAGAVYLAGAPLLLRPQGFDPFFRFLRHRYPQLERAYREVFEVSARVPSTYRGKILRRVERARRLHGLLPWPGEENKSRKRPDESRGKTATFRQLEFGL